MSRYASAIAVCLAFAVVAAASPSSAAEQLPLRFFTQDGTWDCKDDAGTLTGTIVLVDEAYAFIKTDGKLGGYGTISDMEGDFHLPKFTVRDGYLKNEMKAIGVAFHGPHDDPEDYNSELYLFIVVGLDGKQHWDCTRRGGRANAPPA
jgi:hypothetical protein